MCDAAAPLPVREHDKGRGRGRLTTDCDACPLRGCEAFVPLTPAELDFMKQFKSGELTVAAGTVVLDEGSDSPHLFTVLSGYGIRAKSLPDGRRQVINFLLRGDLIGLQAEMLGEMTHSVEAVTEMTLCTFSRRRVWELFETSPARAYDLTWLAAREESLLGDRLVSVGRMSGDERVAHGLATLYMRAGTLGLVQDGRMRLPFRQRDFADALGLSLVHTNKILRRLREEGVARWRSGMLEVFDLAALRREAWIETERPRPRPLI